MRLELSAFIGIALSLWLFLGFFLEWYNNQKADTLKKEIYLEKRRCEVCFSVYFISRFFSLWRCPLCGSLNREQPRKPEEER
jgi:hypothetical protein